ncbi:hypothetical protein Sjap_009770 [Stephania japonica]|uniref:Uncharacterized protein n=1 Tax=Stephania japonica TaxID=461633 RepID=A0AAP0J8B5_9MAGN
MAPKYHRYHVRSTSLPSTPHPLTAAVEEQLDKSRGWLDSMSCSQVHQSEEPLQSGFCGLTGLYESVEDLLQSHHTQQVLVQYRHEKLVDKLLDGSLTLVDVTSTTRDALLRMKECVEQTQSTLRRTRGELSCLRNETTNYSYMLCRKKLHKEMQKFIGYLRDQEKRYAKPTDIVDKDIDFVAIVRVLRNVEAITISVFETLLSLAPASIKSLGGKPASRWSLIPKLIHKRRIACEVEQNECNAASTCAVKPCNDQKEVMNVQNAQRQLQAMEASIRGLEEGFECALRRLIKTRVCLLNILNN